MPSLQLFLLLLLLLLWYSNPTAAKDTGVQIALRFVRLFCCFVHEHFLISFAGKPGLNKSLAPPEEDNAITLLAACSLRKKRRSSAVVLLHLHIRRVPIPIAICPLLSPSTDVVVVRRLTITFGYGCLSAVEVARLSTPTTVLAGASSSVSKRDASCRLIGCSRETGLQLPLAASHRVVV